MADSKISALTDGGLIKPDDEVAIARSATSFRALPLGADGWISDAGIGETWTYASGSGGGTATFTVSGDQRAKYTVGTRIKLTQTTVKYFVVVADPTFASSTTTVTISGGSDYTLANAAISANYHSYVANPQGFPGWFNFAGAVTGFSSTTLEVYRFRVIGRCVFIFVKVSGTSNATTLTWTLPVIYPGTGGVDNLIVPHLTANNGTNANGRSLVAAGSTTVVVTNSITATAFTASGTKITEEEWFYEI